MDEQLKSQITNSVSATQNTAVQKEATTQPPKRSLDDPSTLEETKKKKRKENKEDAKAKRAAEIASAGLIAQTIFQQQKPAICHECIELRKKLENVESDFEDAKHSLRMKNTKILQMLKEKEEKDDDFIDVSSALEAKRGVIRDLEEEIGTLKREIEELKSREGLDQTSTTGVSTDVTQGMLIRFTLSQPNFFPSIV